MPGVIRIVDARPGYATRLGVLILAGYRLTRLVTRDDFPPILALRNKVVRYRPGHSALHYSEQNTWRDEPVAWWGGELMLCPYCASAYITAVLVAWNTLRHGSDDPLLDWAAVWGGAALLNRWAQ